MEEVETRYVKADAGWIAFQVVGSGPVDVLVNKPVWFPIDLMWDEPTLVQFLNDLSSFSRHVWFDALGSGASDPIDQAEGGLAESSVDQMLAVVDALALEQVVVLGLGGHAAAMFAAAHPKRTKALVLVDPFARIRRADDYPEGIPDEHVDHILARSRERWGTGRELLRLAPSLRDDARFAHWAAKAGRLSQTPSDGDLFLRAGYERDERHLLGAVRIPTLVVYRTGNKGAAQSRYVADHITGSKRVELPGDDHLFFAGETRPMLDAIEEFVTGGVAVRDDDRVLATVMFTDVVGSTEQLVEHGDRRWQELLDSHDMVVRREIERFRGREINTMGDAFVATFDGPGRAIRCAGTIRDALQGLSIDVRIGLHAGEIERRGDDIGGIAVHIAQRVQALARPGEVLASSTVKDLVAGSDINFRDRGTHALKGVPDEWRVFTADV